MGDGEEVQDRVGRARERDGHGDRVLEGLAGQDVARPDAGLEQLDHRLPARRQSLRFGSPTASCAELLGSDRPERLDGGRHGVGRVHAAAAAGTRDGRALDVAQLLIGNLAGGARADRLEHRHDVAPVRARTRWCRRRRTPPGD